MNWQINISPKDIKYVLNSCKKFFETILKAWVEINYKQITPLTDVNELMHQCIWFNSHIRVQNKPIFYKHMVSKHFLNVSDLMKYRNTFFSYAEVCDKYNCQFNIMDYSSLISAIPLKNRLKEQHDPSNRIQDHLYYKIVHKQEGLCKFLYNRFIIKRYDKIPTSQLSWPNEFMNEDFYFQLKTWKEIYMNVYLEIYKYVWRHECVNNIYMYL